MAQNISQYGQKTMLDSTNRRRPITSCLECYRRKQKCNRLQPCDQCSARKVPEKCHFSRDSAAIRSSLANRASAISLETNEDNSNDHDETPSPSSLIGQAGYSASPGSSTFLRLSSSSFGSTIYPQSTSHQGLPLTTSYLQAVAQLPSPEIVQDLLDYFRHDVYWVFMALDEHYLLNLFHQWRATPVEEYIGASPNSPQRELLYFPALLFQVLAQILHNLSPEHPAAKKLKISEYTDCDKLSQTYHLLGIKIMSLLDRKHPTLCSVEHDIISGAWLKDSSRGSEAWHKLGDAVRQAQELGLHRLPQSVEQLSGESLESTLIKAWDLERRKRIWNRLFILDSLLALLLGRPRLINREDFTTPAPLDIEYPKEPAQTLPVSSANPAFFEIAVFLSLAHKIHDMMSLSAQGAFIRDYSKLLTLHEEISSLRYQIPSPPPGNGAIPSENNSTLRLSVLRLSLLNTINAVLMALHRPLITSHSASRSAAVNAALDGLDLQHSIFNLVPHSQSRFYGTAFSTIEACIFLCGVMMELPPQDPIEDRRIRQAIVQGTARLSAIKDRSALASSGEQILQQFYQEIQVARPPGREHGDWFQPQPQRIDAAENAQLPRDIRIPSPEQPPYETFQLLFPREQSSAEVMNILQNEDWDLGDPVWEEIEGLENSTGML